MANGSGANGSGGIFGPTPAQVRAAQADERLQRAQVLGSLGRFASSAIGGQLFGQAVGEAFGAEDPRLRQAMELQRIGQEMEAENLNPGDPGFADEAARRVRARLGQQAAVQTYLQAIEIEKQRAEIDQIRQAPEAQRRQIEGRAAVLTQAGVPFDAALVMAQDAELFRQIMSKRLSPPELTSLQREAAAAFPGDPARQRQVMADILKRRAAPPSAAVQINLGDQVEKIRQTELAKMKARKVPAQQELGASIENLLERAETSKLSVTNFDRYDQARRRLAKAIAQQRNPAGTEASQVAEQAAYEALPGFPRAFADPGSVRAIASDLLKEADPEAAAVLEQVQSQLPPGVKIKSIKRVE